MQTGAERMDGAQSGFQSHPGCGELGSVTGPRRKGKGGKEKGKAQLASLWYSRAGSIGHHAFFENLGPYSPPCKE